jgi:hypothetical protein
MHDTWFKDAISAIAAMQRRGNRKGGGLLLLLPLSLSGAEITTHPRLSRLKPLI